MKHQRGFTLIELLVVLVIISLLVSMAVINTNYDPRPDELKEEGKRIKFYLESVSDEAIFKDKNLGLLFTTSKVYVFTRELVADPNNPNSDPTPQWKEFTGRFAKSFPEEQYEEKELSLKINGSPVLLSASYNPEKQPKPQLIVRSTGEQQVAHVSISMPDFDFQQTVRGNGTGRYFLDELSDEI